MAGRRFMTDPDQLDAFERDRLRFGRRLQGVSVAEKASSEPLEEVVSGLVRNYLQETNHGFRCLGIAVDGGDGAGDGMSWSAHAVDRAIEDEAPRVDRLCLKGEPGARLFPELAQIISMRRIAGLAQKHGLVTSVRLLGARLYAVMVAAAIAAGVALAWLTSLASHAGSSASVTRFAVISAGVVALTLCGKALSQALIPDVRAPALAKVAHDIAEQAKAPTDAYQAFIDDLAARLARSASLRCLIVDDLTALDKTTRLTLESYLRHQASESRSEIWVIFYYAAIDKTIELAVNGPARKDRKPVGYRYTRLYKLENLSPAQRRELAEDLGVPERAAFRTVRAIARDDSGLISVTQLFDREHKARRPSAAAARPGDRLDFFYIFALNAVCGGNPWLYETDIRTNFSRERKYRSQVLRLLMPGRNLSATTIVDYLATMSADSFFTLAGELDGQARLRKFRAAAESGEVFERSWRDYDLADPRLAHLFWALYWSDTKLHGKPDVSFLRKISAHLLRSATPAELDELAGSEKIDVPAFTNELFNIALQTLAACLRTCLLGDVADLLGRALRLTEDDDENVRRRRRARLRPLAWQAYEFLADERILSVVLDLEPRARREPAVASAVPDLEDLFLQSMPSATGEVRELMRNELTGARAESAAVYARTRAGWLAASMAPFAGPGTALFASCAQDARDRLPVIVAEAAARLEAAADEEWRTTDTLNVVLGLWSLTLTSDDRRAALTLGWQSAPDLDAALVDALVKACVLGTDLAAQRRSAVLDPATVDLVLDCLAEELLTVVLAAGVLLLARWQGSGLMAETEQSGELAELADVVTESATALGIRVPIDLLTDDGSVDQTMISDTERRMTLLTMLWRRLGLEQQASFMAVRQAQFMAGVYPRDAALAGSGLHLLATEFKQADHIGLLAHLAAAQCAAVSDQLAAQLLARCSQVSTKGGFSDRLSAELCYTAIENGHSFGVDLAEQIDFLRAKQKGGGSRLDTVLAEIPAEHMASTVLEFLNTVHDDDDSARVDAVYEALERRAASIADPDINKELKSRFRTFEIQRHTSAGNPVDVDIELDEWESMRDLSVYAFLLSLLLPATPEASRDRITREAVEILQSPETYIRSTGYVYLAHRLFLQLKPSRNGARSKNTTVALDALRYGFYYWEQSLKADVNLQILRLLARYDAERADDYGVHRVQWERVALELDETERLPRLIDQGRFFVLIWHYFQFFADYGLQSDPPTDPFGLSDDELKQALNEWRASHRSTPEPMTGNGAGARLSGAFLAYGYALFFSPASAKGRQPAVEKELEKGRKQFDDKARGAIDVLYQMLRELPRIPRSIEQILARHQDLVLARLNAIE